jgi:hypothetical protein
MTGYFNRGKTASTLRALASRSHVLDAKLLENCRELEVAALDQLSLRFE